MEDEAPMEKDAKRTDRNSGNSSQPTDKRQGGGGGPGGGGGGSHATTKPNTTPATTTGTTFVKTLDDSNPLDNPFRAFGKKSQKRNNNNSNSGGGSNNKRHKKKKFKKNEPIETIQLVSSSGTSDDDNDVIFVPISEEEKIIRIDDSDDDSAAVAAAAAAAAGDGDDGAATATATATINNKLDDNLARDQNNANEDGNNAESLGGDGGGGDVEFAKPLSPGNSAEKRFENSSCCTSPSSIVSYDDFIMHNDRQRLKKIAASEKMFFPDIEDALAEAPIAATATTETSDRTADDDDDDDADHNKALIPTKEVKMPRQMTSGDSLKDQAAQLTDASLLNNSNIAKIINIYDSDSGMSDINRGSSSFSNLLSVSLNDSNDLPNSNSTPKTKPKMRKTRKSLDSLRSLNSSNSNPNTSNAMPESFDKEKILHMFQQGASSSLATDSKDKLMMATPPAGPSSMKRKSRASSLSDKSLFQKEDNSFFAQLRFLAEGNDGSSDESTHLPDNEAVDSVFQKVKPTKHLANEGKQKANEENPQATVSNQNEQQTNKNKDKEKEKGNDKDKEKGKAKEKPKAKEKDKEKDKDKEDEHNDAGLVDRINPCTANRNKKDSKTNDSAAAAASAASPFNRDRQSLPFKQVIESALAAIDDIIKENKYKSSSSKVAIEDEEMPSPPPPPALPKGIIKKQIEYISALEAGRSATPPPIATPSPPPLPTLAKHSKKIPTGDAATDDDADDEDSCIIIDNQGESVMPGTSAKMRAQFQQQEILRQQQHQYKHETVVPKRKVLLPKPTNFFEFSHKDTMVQWGLGWSEEQIRFYNWSWNGENLDLSKLFAKMNTDRRLWKINPADQARPSNNRRDTKLKCYNCNNHGHRKADCPHPLKPKICRMCGWEGHLEPECPNKCCLRCGTKSNGFYRSCNSCIYHCRTRCEVCCFVGHNSPHCPDHWRRYHATTKNVDKLKQCQPIKNKTPYCSYCGRAGHYAEACRKEKHPRDYPAVSSRIFSYERTYKPSPLTATKQKHLLCNLLYTPYQISVKNKSLFAPARRSPWYSRVLNEIGLGHLNKPKRPLDQSPIKQLQQQQQLLLLQQQQQQQQQQQSAKRYKNDDKVTQQRNSTATAADASAPPDEQPVENTDSDGGDTQTATKRSFEPYVSPFGPAFDIASLSRKIQKTNTSITTNKNNSAATTTSGSGSSATTASSSPSPSASPSPTAVTKTFVKVQPLLTPKTTTATTSAIKSNMVMPLSVPNASLPLPSRQEVEDLLQVAKLNNAAKPKEKKEVKVDQTVVGNQNLDAALHDSDSNYSFSDHFETATTMTSAEANDKDQAESQAKNPCKRPPIGPTPDFIPIPADDLDNNLFEEQASSPEPEPNNNQVEKAKIILTPENSSFLRSSPGERLLRTLIGDMRIVTKIVRTKPPVLELEGPSQNLEIFQNLLFESLQRHSIEMQNKNIDPFQTYLTSINLPKRVGSLIRLIRDDLCTLKTRIGQAYDIYERLSALGNQVQPSKNGLKTINKLRRNLNMILIGQAGLDNGKNHILAIFDILKDLVCNYDKDDKVPGHIRNTLFSSWKQVFAPIAYPNYPDLIQQYRQMQTKNQYLLLALDPMILGERIINNNMVYMNHSNTNTNNNNKSNNKNNTTNNNSNTGNNTSNASTNIANTSNSASTSSNTGNRKIVRAIIVPAAPLKSTLYSKPYDHDYETDEDDEDQQQQQQNVKNTTSTTTAATATTPSTATATVTAVTSTTATVGTCTTPPPPITTATVATSTEQNLEILLSAITDNTAPLIFSSVPNDNYYSSTSHTSHTKRNSNKNNNANNSNRNKTQKQNTNRSHPNSNNDNNKTNTTKSSKNNSNNATATTSKNVNAKQATNTSATPKNTTKKNGTKTTNNDDQTSNMEASNNSANKTNKNNTNNNKNNSKTSKNNTNNSAASTSNMNANKSATKNNNNTKNKNKNNTSTSGANSGANSGSNSGSGSGSSSNKAKDNSGSNDNPTAAGINSRRGSNSYSNSNNNSNSNSNSSSSSTTPSKDKKSGSDKKNKREATPSQSNDEQQQHQQERKRRRREKRKRQRDERRNRIRIEQQQQQQQLEQQQQQQQDQQEQHQMQMQIQMDLEMEKQNHQLRLQLSRQTEEHLQRQLEELNCRRQHERQLQQEQLEILQRQLQTLQQQQAESQQRAMQLQNMQDQFQQQQQHQQEEEQELNNQQQRSGGNNVEPNNNSNNNINNNNSNNNATNDNTTNSNIISSSTSDYSRRSRKSSSHNNNNNNISSSSSSRSTSDNNDRRGRGLRDELPPFMNPEQRSNVPANLYIANKNWENSCAAVFAEIERNAAGSKQTSTSTSTSTSAASATAAAAAAASASASPSPSPSNSTSTSTATAAAAAASARRSNRGPSVYWSRESIRYLEQLGNMVGPNSPLTNSIRRFLARARENQLNSVDHAAILKIFNSAQNHLR